MEHAEALQGKFAEKYYLGELAVADAERFELHFFECTECAQAVESCHTFVTAARPILAEGELADAPDVPERTSWWAGLGALWQQRLFAFSATATLLFGALLVYQAVRPAQQEQLVARAFPASFQLSSASRGEIPHVAVKSGAQAVLLSGDVPPDAVFAEHRYVLTTGGRTIFRITAPPPEKGQPFSIEVPLTNLTPGLYELTAYGISKNGQADDKIAAYSFNLDRNQ